MGPDPVTLDVPAHLVPNETGLALVDTGTDPSGAAIDSALVAAGASWSDLSHVVLTHGHRPHRRAGPRAPVGAGSLVLASPLEGLPDTGVLADGDFVGSLRVFATPGHPVNGVAALALLGPAPDLQPRKGQSAG